MVKYVHILEESALVALQPQWRGLCERANSRHYNQSFNWVLSGWSKVASKRGRELAVVAGYSDDELVFIWPLSITSSGFTREVQWLGPETSEYREVLVDDNVDAAECVDGALAFLRRQLAVDLVVSPYVREESKLHQALAEVSYDDLGVAPYVDLTEWDDWDAYFASRSKSFRSENRRSLKKLEKQGEVTFHVIEDIDEAHELIAWIMQLKRDWTARMGIVNRWFDGDSYESFLQMLANDALPRPLLITVLKLDGKTVAAALSFLYQGKIESYFGVYDIELSKFAPGRVLDYLQMQWAFEQKIKVFDFRLGSEAYKYKWINKEMRYFDYLIPLSYKGRVKAWWQHSALRDLLRNAFTLLPESLRQRLKPV